MAPPVGWRDPMPTPSPGHCEVQQSRESARRDVRRESAGACLQPFKLVRTATVAGRGRAPHRHGVGLSPWGRGSYLVVHHGEGPHPPPLRGNEPCWPLGESKPAHRLHPERGAVGMLAAVAHRSGEPDHLARRLLGCSTPESAVVGAGRGPRPGGGCRPEGDHGECRTAGWQGSRRGAQRASARTCPRCGPTRCRVRRRTGALRRWPRRQRR